MKNLTIDQICEAALDLALEKFGSLEIFYDDSGSKKIGSELKNNKEKTIKATQDGFDVKFGAVALETNVEDFKREYLESEITNLISNIKKDIKTSQPITPIFRLLMGESGSPEKE